MRERALLLGLARPHLESLLVALGKSALARGTRVSCRAAWAGRGRVEKGSSQAALTHVHGSGPRDAGAPGSEAGVGRCPWRQVLFERRGCGGQQPGTVEGFVCQALVGPHSHPIPALPPLPPPPPPHTQAKQDLKAVQEQLEASRAEVEALKKRVRAEAEG